MIKKSIILILVSLYVIINPLIAEIGIKLGVNFNKLKIAKKNKHPFSLDRTTNIQFGVFHKLTITSKLLLQTELYYVKYRGKTTGMFWNSKIGLEAILTNLKLPILLNFIILNSKKREGGFLAGPYFAYNLKCKTIVSYNDKSDVTDITNQINKYHYGFLYGIYYNFNNIVFDVRLSLGRVKMLNDSDIGSLIKNKSIIIMIGYRF